MHKPDLIVTWEPSTARAISLSVTFIFLLTFLSCNSPTEPVQNQPPGIIGSWKWIESFGGNMGHITPETWGYTQTYRFDLDSSFYRYWNDTLVFQSSYRISLKSGGCFWFPDKDTCEVLQIENDEIHEVQFSGFDTLTLSPVGFDAPYSRFVRQRGVLPIPNNWQKLWMFTPLQ